MGSIHWDRWRPGMKNLFKYKCVIEQIHLVYLMILRDILIRMYVEILYNLYSHEKSTWMVPKFNHARHFRFKWCFLCSEKVRKKRRKHIKNANLHCSALECLNYSLQMVQIWPMIIIITEFGEISGAIDFIINFFWHSEPQCFLDTSYIYILQFNFFFLKNISTFEYFSSQTHRA